MLLKIKAIIAFAAVSGVGGVFAGLAGADWITALGPGAGALVAGAIGYAVKESLPLVSRYIYKAFGVKVEPPVEGQI